MRKVFIAAIIFSLKSCSQEPKIVINEDYIINRHWDNYNNDIHVEKMKLKKDSVLDIFSSDFKKEVPNHWNITNKLEADSTSYFGYSGLNIKKNKVKLKDKIFFNKDNGFEWYSESGNKTVVGSLEKDTWYKFSNLRTVAYYIYVYVDNEGELHRYNVNMSNY